MDENAVCRSELKKPFLKYDVGQKERTRMKSSWLASLMVAIALNASPTDQISGKWTLDFCAPVEQPKSVGEILLDLKVDGMAVSGLVTIGAWPGEAPIADGKLDGKHITFNATEHRDSTTGIPTCHFEATVDGDEMDLKMTVIRNPGGPLGAGIIYDFKGKKDPK
jgi:hypothetical protein